MANPTMHHGWILPRPEDTPWYEKFARLWDDIDTFMAFAAFLVPIYNQAVSAVETSAPPNHALVWSAQPTDLISITTTPGELLQWTTVSFAPFGKVVGSFLDCR